MTIVFPLLMIYRIRNIVFLKEDLPNTVLSFAMYADSLGLSPIASTWLCSGPGSGMSSYVSA